MTSLISFFVFGMMLMIKSFDIKIINFVIVTIIFTVFINSCRQCLMFLNPESWDACIVSQTLLVVDGQVKENHRDRHHRHGHRHRHHHYMMLLVLFFSPLFFIYIFILVLTLTVLFPFPLHLHPYIAISAKVGRVTHLSYPGGFCPELAVGNSRPFAGGTSYTGIVTDGYGTLRNLWHPWSGFITSARRLCRNAIGSNGRELSSMDDTDRLIWSCRSDGALHVQGILWK